MTTLIDEAAFHGKVDFPETLASIEGFHAKVMFAFLEYPEIWAGATHFLYSDNISDSHWKKRNDLPHLTPHVESEDAKLLEDGIGQYFRSKQGRGRNCKVEIFRRYNKEYFFAYPEDFAQTGIEWIRNQLNNRARHPAFEIIFVYTQEEGSLDIYAPRNTKSVPNLQQIFAKAILKVDDLDEFSGDERVYDLNVLANRDFIFKYPVESGIESVAIKRLRLSLKTGDKRRVTLETDPKDNLKSVYDLMDSLQLPPNHVTQAEIKVKFAPTPGTRSRMKSFSISFPNSCNLKYDERDLTIRKMLVDSGIEPKLLEKT